MSRPKRWGERGTYGYDYVSTYDDRGYKVDCQLVVRDDNERGVVRGIFEWCVYEGSSTYAIARRLSAKGVPTLREKDQSQPNEGISAGE